MATEERELRKKIGLEPKGGRGKVVLELLFITLFGLVTICAFVSALRYDFVSARTPLCILVPMLLLIALQFHRARKAARLPDLKAEFAEISAGLRRPFNASLGLIAWMVLLLLAIYVVGQYVGMVLFMFALLRFVAKERLTVSIGVTVAVTLCTYLLFEHLFHIQLYRGVLTEMILGVE